MTDMFSPGATLRAAREKRRLAVGDVAEATRIKRHIIEAIENNDFSGISAPLYGRGFIKLYAEHVGLDPAPLINDYMTRYARTVRPSLKSERAPAPTGEQGLPAPSTLDRFRTSRGAAWRQAADDALLGLIAMTERVGMAWTRWRLSRRTGASGSRRPAGGYTGPGILPAWSYAAIGAAAVLLAVLLAVAIHALMGQTPAVRKPAATAAGAAKAAPAPRPLRLAEEPPPAYIRVKAP